MISIVASPAAARQTACPIVAASSLAEPRGMNLRNIEPVPYGEWLAGGLENAFCSSPRKRGTQEVLSLAGVGSGFRLRGNERILWPRFACSPVGSRLRGNGEFAEMNSVSAGSQMPGNWNQIGTDDVAQHAALVPQSR